LRKERQKFCIFFGENIFKNYNIGSCLLSSTCSCRRRRP
jgi:hypothetical protein